MSETKSLQSLPSGFESTLNEQQAKSLADLEERINQGDYAKDYARDPAGKNLLLQFLRATMKDKSGERVFQVDAAEQRLISTFKWRQEFNTNELQDAVVNGTKLLPDKYDIFLQLYPNLDVVDEHGHFVRFNRFGRFISTIDVNILTMTEWNRCFAYDCFDLQHRLRELGKKHGREISTYTVVSDLNGLAFMGVASRLSFIKFMSGVASNNFPEMMGQTILPRGPLMLPKIFNLVKPFIDKDVQNKFVLRSDIPTELIAAVIPMELIPKEYGGTNETALPLCLYDLKKA